MDQQFMVTRVDWADFFSGFCAIHGGPTGISDWFLTVHDGFLWIDAQSDNRRACDQDPMTVSRSKWSEIMRRYFNIFDSSWRISSTVSTCSWKLMGNCSWSKYRVGIETHKYLHRFDRTLVHPASFVVLKDKMWWRIESGNSLILSMPPCELSIFIL